MVKEQSQSRWAQGLHIFLVATTLLVAALLVFQCARIYAAGTAAENMTEAGVRIHDIYSREIVAQHFGQISWALILWLVALAAMLVGRAWVPQTHHVNPAMAPQGRLALLKLRVASTPTMQAEVKKRQWLSIACAAVCLVCIGMAGAYFVDLNHFASRDLEMVMGAMLLHIAPWVVVAFVALMALAQARNQSMLREIEAAKDAPKWKPEPLQAQKKALPLALTGQIVLGIGAITLLIAGVVNGGMYDVLVKAVNICTECIGLG